MNCYSLNTEFNSTSKSLLSLVNSSSSLVYAAYEVMLNILSTSDHLSESSMTKNSFSITFLINSMSSVKLRMLAFLSSESVNFFIRGKYTTVLSEFYKTIKII